MRPCGAPIALNSILVTQTKSQSAHWKAVRRLLVANLFWGLSFPAAKALTAVQASALPGRSTWFLSSLALVVRFAAAALVMLWISRGTVRQLTRSELSQGVGLGLFAALGLVFQMDGLAHTAASTSAFLTQCYCVIIPVWIAVVERRWPSSLTWVSCLLVIGGVGVLSGLDWRTLHLGRGELETIIASVIFTGQILWLQRPSFAGNNVNHFSAVMFSVIAIACVPVAAATTTRVSDWWVAWQTGASWVLVGILFGFCTLGAYVLMNRWQPFLTSVQAGLIYCVEPVCASVFALFLPAWFSRLGGIDYPNETLTNALWMGGSLVTAANVLIQLEPTPKPPEAAG